MEYAALFEPDPDGGFVVTIPDFAWGISQGNTDDDAQRMATALLQTLIQEHIGNGENLPKPTRPRGKKYRFIQLSTLKNAKAELYCAFQSSGLRKAELARRIGIAKSNVDRLFDLGSHTRLEQIEAAFAALGKRIAIEIRDAA